MQDKIQIGILNGYYGGILNEHQREIMRMYFDCDMSLSEISGELNITRQAVREIIVRSKEKLTKMEGKLQLVAKVNEISSKLQSLIANTKDSNIKSELEKILNDIKEI